MKKAFFLLFITFFTLSGCSLIKTASENQALPPTTADQVDENATNSDEPLLPPVVEDFISGHYTNGTSYIDIQAIESNVKFQGYAEWFNNAGVIHFGEVSGLKPYEDDAIVYKAGESDYDCQLTIKFNEKTLVVSDNKHCGGLNVTFDGIYTRTGEAPDTFEIYDSQNPNL